MFRVYDYLDYREALQDAADERKTQVANYNYSSLAKALKIQAPYLSRVFRKQAHLSTDQLDLACQDFQFSEEEQEYLFLLLEYHKSALLPRKDRLKKRIQAIRNANLDTKKHLTAEIVGPGRDLQLQEYYLDPLAPLVHSFLQLTYFQKEPIRICQNLGCTPARLKKVLTKLEKLDLIRYLSKESRYEALNPFLHLDRNSALNDAFQFLSRSLCGDRLRNLGPEDKHQYTVTLTADDAVMDLIYSEFNSLLKKIESFVKSSKPEGVYQLNFDLFRWDSRKK